MTDARQKTVARLNDRVGALALAWGNVAESIREFNSLHDAEMRTLREALECAYAQAFPNGHRETCRKTTRIGVECSCGADALAEVLLALTQEQAHG